MCLLIVNTQKTLTLDTFTSAELANPDGCGIAWADGKKVRTYRHMKAQETYKRYSEVREANNSAILVHFRYATHGSHGIENAHPFKIGKRIAFAHNGVLDTPSTLTGASDTRHLVELLRQLRNPHDLFRASSIVRQFVEHWAKDSHSKFAMLDGQGQYAIANEAAGYWDNGDWYSNRSHLYTQTSYATGYGWECSYTPKLTLTDTPSIYEKAETLLEYWSLDPVPQDRVRLLKDAQALALELGCRSVSDAYDLMKDYGRYSREAGSAYA